VALDCTQLLLVNVCAPHPTRLDGHWFYVYDEDLYATRVHISERLSPHNAVPSHTAVQAECYFGRHRPLTQSPDTIAAKVAHELVAMGFVDADALDRGAVQICWRWVPHANIVFTHSRRDALDTVLRWLEQFGLTREEDDLAPARDWDAPTHESPGRSLLAGRLMLAGRFAQWKYFWTDDCVLRGRQLAGELAADAARNERCDCLLPEGRDLSVRTL
jgi:hypothetical protein